MVFYSLPCASALTHSPLCWGRTCEPAPSHTCPGNPWRSGSWRGRTWCPLWSGSCSGRAASPCNSGFYALSWHDWRRRDVAASVQSVSTWERWVLSSSPWGCLHQAGGHTPGRSPWSWTQVSATQKRLKISSININRTAFILSIFQNRTFAYLYVIVYNSHSGFRKVTFMAQISSPSRKRSMSFQLKEAFFL